MRNKASKRIPPGAWFLASAVAMVILNSVLRGVQLIPVPYRYGGIVFVLVGLAIGLWALSFFEKIGTTLRPSKAPSVLVVRGPFRFSRHPMYLGLTFALCGFALLLGSLTPWAIVLAFFVLVARRSALAEEELAEKIFGDGYRRYKRRVRRWF